jgi:Tol biopolymer transport system component
MTLSDFNASGISPHFASNRWQIVFAGSSPVTSADPAAPEVNVLYTIDAVAGGAPRQITKEGYLADPSFSPDSKDIVCVSDPTRRFEYDIAVMHLATRRIQQLNVTRETHLCRSPVFTPDGKHILFLGDVNPAGGKHSGLYEVDRTGANLRRIAGSDLFYDPTGWRP